MLCNKMYWKLGDIVETLKLLFPIACICTHWILRHSFLHLDFVPLIVPKGQLFETVVCIVSIVSSSPTQFTNCNLAIIAKLKLLSCMTQILFWHSSKSVSGKLLCMSASVSNMKHPTLHTALYPVDELVGLAAVQQSPDGWKRIQDNGLRVGVNIVLKHRDTNIFEKINK